MPGEKKSRQVCLILGSDSTGWKHHFPGHTQGAFTERVVGDVSNPMAGPAHSS